MPAVDKFNYRVKFFYPVFYGGSGKHDSECRFQLLHIFRGPGLPVFNPLGLIENNQVRGPLPDVIYIPEDELIIDKFIKRFTPVKLLPLIIETLYHLYRPSAEFIYFGLPLVFQRGRRDDQDLPDTEKPRH